MRLLCVVSLATAVFSVMAMAQSTPSAISSLIPKDSLLGAPTQSLTALPEVAESYGKLPLTFEANRGQNGNKVKFLSRSKSYTLFLTGNEAVFAFSPATRRVDHLEGLEASLAPRVLRMKLVKANPTAKVLGEEKMAGASNYFIGNDRSKWRTNVPTYTKVKYNGIYSGIDLVYYGNQRQLEYDFVVAPGADPRCIAFDIRGAEHIRRNEHGDLVLTMGEGEIRWHQPVVYQEKDGKRQEIEARYAITSRNRVSFDVAEYDRSSPLYIDPLIYSTYLGGSGADVGYGIAVDSAGDAFVVGQTYSTDFPTAAGAFQMACRGKSGRGCSRHGEAFVAKLNPTGTALIYSTYLGGSGGDSASAIAIDRGGNAYITGQTYSINFPTTPGAFQSNCRHNHPCGKGDVFVAKLNATGSSLIYSTYVAGSGTDWAAGIVVDKAGNAYVTGGTSSTNFPVTPGAFQTVCQDELCALGDAFVAKLNPAGSALVYSTYLGGIANDYGRGIAVDKAGNAYITGGTTSTNFPVTAGAFQAVCGDAGCALDDAFVAKLNPTGTALVYSTYLGGNDYDIGTGIVLDRGGNAYVVGVTGSTDFPTKNPLQSSNAGAGDAFITKLNSSGTALAFSTYLGGDGQDNGSGITLDNAGNIYVIGGTSSNNFPAVNPVQSQNLGYANAFIAEIDHSGSAFVYSTYLGGSNYDVGTSVAVDGAGNAYLTGATASADFPTMNPLQPAINGVSDAFVAQIGVRVQTVTALSSSPNPSKSGQVVTLTATVTSSQGAPQNGEAVSFMEGTATLGTVNLSGGLASFTTSTLPVGNNPITAVYGGETQPLPEAHRRR